MCEKDDSSEESSNQFDQDAKIDFKQREVVQEINKINKFYQIINNENT
jgi:hypothetical protein